MCSVICLGHTAQVQQREIILVFLKTLPSHYLSLVAHSIILIMGCDEEQGERESGEMSTASTAWPRLSARGRLRVRGRTSWRRAGDLSSPLQSLMRRGTDRCCLLGRTAMETGMPRGSYSSSWEKSSNLTLLNVTAVPRSLCRPGVRLGEVLVAAQAVGHYLGLQLICVNWGGKK